MDRLVWIDCEMTGLDLARDRLLEVACLVTDSDLDVLGEGIDVVIGAPAEALAAMLPVVHEMHARSGLTEASAASALTVADAEQLVLGYLREYVPEAGKAPLCGNSIATDRGFLARDMPTLDAWMHYRMVDVSSIKELVRRWYPKLYFAAPAKQRGHRALADIGESIAELRYYREAVFLPRDRVSGAAGATGSPSESATGSPRESATGSPRESATGSPRESATGSPSDSATGGP